MELSKVGNTKGLDLYKSILLEKVRLGGSNEIMVHKNIAIHNSVDDKLVIKLPEEVLWPMSKDGSTTYLRFEPCETNEELLCISLKKPPRYDFAPHELDSCSDLVSFFNFSKKKGYQFHQHKWPQSHIKNYR